MLTPQLMEELQLVDGSEVEVRKATGATAEISHLSDDEANGLFERIEPLHRKTFQELAK